MDMSELFYVYFIFLYKNDYDINRVNLNSFAHKWHELFLPQNILDIAAEIFMNYDELPFLYLNFCALGPTLKDNIYNSVNNEKTLKNINEIENNYNIIKISHRKKFHTIFINYN